MNPSHYRLRVRYIHTFGAIQPRFRSECFGLNGPMYENRTDQQAHTIAHITLLPHCHRTIHWQLATIILNSRYKGTNLVNTDQIYMRIVCAHLTSIWEPPIQSKGIQVVNGATVYYLAYNARLHVTSGSVHCRNNRPYTIMVAGKLSFVTFQSHLSPEARARYKSCDVKGQKSDRCTDAESALM